MIRDEREYGVTIEEIGRFAGRIAEMERDGVPDGADPRLFRAELDGYKSMRDELQGQADVYEQARSGAPSRDPGHRD